MDIEILATLGLCCGILRRGMNEPNVMHNGLCRERHDGCLGPTIYLVDAAEVASLRAELAEYKRDVEIVRFLRCGGWEVLQNPKYWTLENKFYGAIAEAMAEVAAEGDKNGDA